MPGMRVPDDMPKCIASSLRYARFLGLGMVGKVFLVILSIKWKLRNSGSYPARNCVSWERVQATWPEVGDRLPSRDGGRDVTR